MTKDKTYREVSNLKRDIEGVLERVYLFGMNGGLGYGKFEKELSPKDATTQIINLIESEEERLAEYDGKYDLLTSRQLKILRNYHQKALADIKSKLIGGSNGTE